MSCFQLLEKKKENQNKFNRLERNQGNIRSYSIQKQKYTIKYNNKNTGMLCLQGISSQFLAVLLELEIIYVSVS